MNRKQRIIKLLEDELIEFSSEVIDNSELHKDHHDFDGKEETHIKIVLKQKTNISFKRIDIHRKVNDLLKNEFNKGLHSLEIKIN